MLDVAWEIDPITELQMERAAANELGDGFFGTVGKYSTCFIIILYKVYKGMLDGRKVAVKTLKPGTMTTTQFMK